MNRGGSDARLTKNDMHPDTIAAVRLLALALAAHPEDMQTLRIYGDMPAHLADLIDDYIDDDEEEDE